MIDISSIAKCSNNIWHVFKELCVSDYTDKGKFMEWSMNALKSVVNQYEDSELYPFAVAYGHALVDQIERSLYPGKPKPEITRNILRMKYSDFVEYIKDPVPGDMVTVLNEDGGNLARVKIRTVVNT